MAGGATTIGKCSPPKTWPLPDTVDGVPFAELPLASRLAVYSRLNQERIAYFLSQVSPPPPIPRR